MHMLLIKVFALTVFPSINSIMAAKQADIIAIIQYTDFCFIDVEQQIYS